MTAKRKPDSSVTDLYEYTQSLLITKLMFKDVKSESIKTDDYLGKPVEPKNFGFSSFSWATLLQDTSYKFDSSNSTREAFRFPH